jgi:hypothetical protein
MSSPELKINVYLMNSSEFVFYKDMIEDTYSFFKFLNKISSKFLKAIEIVIQDTEKVKETKEEIKKISLTLNEFYLFVQDKCEIVKCIFEEFTEKNVEVFNEIFDLENIHLIFDFKINSKIEKILVEYFNKKDRKNINRVSFDHNNSYFVSNIIENVMKNIPNFYFHLKFYKNENFLFKKILETSYVFNKFISISNINNIDINNELRLEYLKKNYFKGIVYTIYSI